jgi:hypothetical protein
LIDSPPSSIETFPFICSDCGKGFRNKYKLNSHEKKHAVAGSGPGTPHSISANIYNNSDMRICEDKVCFIAIFL